MFRLGLTGSIATGKSTVLEAFKALGAQIYSADQAVHDLYEGEAVGPVSEAFPGTFREGKIDRTALSAQLVGHPERISQLESIVHPLVRRRMRAFSDEAAASGAAIAVFDIPLLYETGQGSDFDAVAVTFCDEQEQRRRALLRPAMTDEKLQTILSRQWSQDQKRAAADFAIDTNQSFAAVEQQVANIFRACTEMKTSDDS
ncbi:MAG: dephospho-CoA kinase [Hyphomicrobiaceae bacterium]|nr:dephospho-CoA kinase [Hyphomicrobiaceae bacterium]MCC0024275.1 dephospho-CoA kinase [Hyphomicrobiaceae bacterium]